ncbi:MAG TPA: hypothetical protein VGN97_14050 [Mesorhizobium sp.]|nr:hypothetical protein [Mesorhizobium sp.]
MFTLMHVLASAANAAELDATTASSEMKGWVARPLLVTNAGRNRLVCQAALAHWLSHDFASLDANQTARLELWFDPLTGTHALRGVRGEPIPLEALWCGISGRVYRTRALIPLDRDRTARASTASVTCRSQGERVVCSPP